MTYTWFVQYPACVVDADGNFSSKILLSYYRSCNERVDIFLQKLELPVRTHRVLILVDLMGVYLGVVRWLEEMKFPLEKGVVASRFAEYFLDQAFLQVQSKVMANYENSIVRADFVRAVFRKKTDSIAEALINCHQVVDVQRSVELSFARVPLEEIKWDLQNEAKRGSSKAKEQFEDIKKGILHPPHGGERRNYSIHDDFIRCMKLNSTFASSMEGFYCKGVKHYGLSYFNEKEVDVHIAIRAVDACNNAEAESICVVSSDQDFLPLQKRGARSNVSVFQADIGNFDAQWRIGRKIKELGEHHIPVKLDPWWTTRLILEIAGHDMANGVPAADWISKGISDAEFEAIFRLHNELNPDKFKLIRNAGGTFGVSVVDR